MDPLSARSATPRLLARPLSAPAVEAPRDAVTLGAERPLRTSGCLAPLDPRAAAFLEMRAEVARCVNTLATLVRAAVPDGQVKAHEALRGLEQLKTGLSAANAIESKRKMRVALWELRQRLEEGPAAGASRDIRVALEKARNACLDVAVERGNCYPGERHTVRPKGSEVPNYLPVAPNLLRGGQVDTDGARWLISQGVTTEIDLRGDDQDNQWVPAEWGPVKRYVIAVEDMKAPTLAQVEEFIRIVDDPANKLAYVHCKAGVGRTGTMVACWRITRGWSVDEALVQERLNSYDGSFAQEGFVREFFAWWSARERAPDPGSVPPAAF